MCFIIEGLKDKKPLSQKLIVRNSRFHEFCTAKLCVETDVYETGLNILSRIAFGGYISEANCHKHLNHIELLHVNGILNSVIDEISIICIHKYFNQNNN